MVAMKRLLFAFAAVFSSLFTQGCTSVGGETLSIHAEHVAARQSMPDEMASLLGELGYDWLPVADPNVRHPVKVAEEDGEYRMSFQHAADRQVRIDVRIRQLDDYTRLHFYETGRQTLSPPSRTLLQKLRERVVMEFGDSNVKISE